MPPTLKGPFIIRWNGVATPDMCLQAAYGGVDAIVSLQPMDFTASNELQLWQVGDDNRIYLNNTPHCLDFVNPPQNGQVLQLSEVIATDETQKWDLSRLPPALVNIGASGTTLYMIDNSGGGTGAGNKVQLWNQAGNDNQRWSFVVVPSIF
jgi:hypothetical protein